MLCVSCEKYLNEKPSAKIATPSTLEDVQLLLKDYARLNAAHPNAAELASDNFYVNIQNLNSASERERKTYLWQENDEVGPFWTSPYRAIFISNIIMETVEKVEGGEESIKKNYYAQARFWRALYHYSLATLFCKPYSKESAETDLGIPLKITADINLIPQRSTVMETYEFIISEIQQALPHLDTDITVKYQPNRAGSYGFLSRIYLAMNDYTKAELYADSCLQIYSTLIDYNEINTSQNVPFQARNAEVILDVQASVASLLHRNRGHVDTFLLKSYSENDLRVPAFFTLNADKTRGFKGHYSGSSSAIQFVGIATDEIYLIKAECSARMGKTDLALKYLNLLLSKRIKKDTFVEVAETDPVKLLHIILLERRKELIARGLRWTDLRRLNQDEKYKETLKRKLGSDIYELLPGGDRYVFKIIKESVEFSGLTQNP
ncbi:SusD-like starch-binding protein associating with outer membrane [Sphingobacterium alimentarium]|uniref:SusD-like starch-binding protein associating with outer membrane n=2 Tax=Sphingobacterium alimentarium TaxID=797292 RepID=A0A4R3VVW4_9SPHI|nr:SusD-like starch-binding protein associating with outer membrane [Sphingobacterium alimentarium]